MIFFEDYSQISAHIQDEITVSIQVNHHSNTFLLVSPSAIALWSSNKEDPETKGTYIAPKSITNLGYFKSSTFLTAKSFACLTSLGSVIFYQITDGGRIVFQTSLCATGDCMFTAIASYQGFAIAGDNNGAIYILSTEQAPALNFPVMQYAIRDLQIGIGYGLALCADGSVTYFKIDPSILSNPDYLMQNRVYINEGISMIATSQRSAFSAAYSPTGILYITDFSGFEQKIECCPQISSMTFSADGQSLIASTKDGIIIWSSQIRRLRYFSLREIALARCICAAEYFMLVAFGKGVAVVPVIKTAPSAIMLIGAHKFWELRPTVGGAITVGHSTTLVGEISDVAADESGRLIGICGTKGVALFAKATANWHRPLQETRQGRFVGFMGKTLCLASFSRKERRYLLTLSKTQISERLEVVKTIQLPGRPTAMRCCVEACVVVCGRAVLCVDALFGIQSFDAGADVSVVEAVPELHSVLILLKDGALLRRSLADGKSIIIGKGISSLFVDRQNKVVIAHSGFGLLGMKINGNCLSLFSESEDIPLSAIPELLGIAGLDPGAVAPFRVSLAPMLDESLVSPEKAEAAVRSSPFALRLLAQYVSQNVRRGKVKEALDFTGKFPDLAPRVLCLTLRTSEAPERASIFREIGGPISVFLDTAKLSMINGVFGPAKGFTQETAELGLLLLEVLLADEGPKMALSAGLCLAANLKEKRDDLSRALISFACALIESSKALDQKTIQMIASAVGTLSGNRSEIADFLRPLIVLSEEGREMLSSELLERQLKQHCSALWMSLGDEKRANAIANA